MIKIVSQLFNAQSEEEVNGILNNDYFQQGSWKPLGREEGNYSTVENQQSHPVASLAEKVTNAIDAILMKECKLRDIDPMGDDAPETMHDAVVEFFGSDEERQKRHIRSKLAELIKIKADGSKTNPNLIITDRGEGQRPQDFEDTFLSLHKSKSGKRNIKFVQGRYYMGGSGVLPYCGDKGYELIVSRSALVDDSWGWTIVRKNRTAEQYEYFVHNERIPTFDVEKFDGIEDGTIIKMYNYDLPHRSTITTDLRNDLDLFIFDIFLPIQIIETRSSLKPSVATITTEGNRRKIENAPDLLEPGYTMPLVIEADFGKYGKRKIEIFLFKSESDLEKGQKKVKGRFTDNDMAVFFTINGQTHSAFPRSFIRTKCGKASLDKDMLVHISFSGISGADRVDIFPPSRDRMKKNTVTKELEETIRDCISEDATLKLLNEIRFRKTVEKSKVDIKFVTQFVTRLIARNPDLRRYLKTGGQVKYTPELGTKIKEQFKPPFYPTIFRIKGWDDKKGLYTKEIPIDSKGSQLSFELNAPDNYFDRILTPGILNVVPGDMLARRKLMSGVLELKFKPTKNMKIGDLHPVTLSVSRHEHEPLTQTFQVKYIAPIPKIPHQPEIPSTTSEPPKVADLGLPEHHLIYKENWGDKWTGQDIVKMMEMNGNAKTSDIKVCINMSSDDLREYLIRNRITDANKRATVEKVYEIGILLYSFLSYVELKKQYESIEEIPIDGVVSTIMKGISKTMLDLHISEEMLKLLITE